MVREASIVAVVGWKNSGKTGLVERLVGESVRRGLRVSTAKHAHHAVDIDQPGRDSWRHREAGAHEVALVSASRFVLQRELRGRAEPSLLEVAATLESVDLLIAEGFKSSPVAKIEAWRDACDRPPLASKDDTVFALAVEGGSSTLSRHHPRLAERLPVFELDDAEGILTAVVNHLKP
ncbi:MAG: molybdopterin-guanine dinucleotide biosynthesis protein B [Hyphomicrobiales bacterium]|nr:molybdopterin-guanine dinucleotide biosynthesis protein B [Hyphomicrobiales bacterium]MCY4048255.1 molybdopterin-guanine dinucleotide biosynthesis protein B [Hyphomicrobiales bacterium]MCY4052791.1 molybdopterin-guanine dinucleotide biosynthesis protein B [Hyphomicrobiales bacterium]